MRKLLLILSFVPMFAIAQSVDYSVVSVPEETGATFTKITNDNDYVCMPQVKRNSRGCSWLSNRVIAVSPNGENIAFVALRNNCTNIFVKNLSQLSTSIQRTNRQGVLDFSYSPDGNYICFSEMIGKTNSIFQTDANKGFVCRQITSGAKDYSPVYSSDMSRVYFARQEKNGVSIWSYDMKGSFLSSYSSGMNPVQYENALLCTRNNSSGRSEIWKIDINTGVEECIVSDPTRNFTTPSVSPNGEWLLFVGSNGISVNGSDVYYNTDIFACHMDGSELVQLTHHAADDLSPVWSKDGRYIYFVSQRGSANATANIWRMNFVYANK